MPTILYIKSSPRGSRSRCTTVADAFIEQFQALHDDCKLVRRDLSSLNLTPFDESAVNAKYAVMHNQEMEIDEHAAWLGVTDWIAEFCRADIYVFAIPMWNFSIPYTLKHYFDLIVQPRHTFMYDPETGYHGMLEGKRAFVSFARGGVYEGAAAAIDFQKPYVEHILRFMGITDVSSVVVEPTVAGEPDAMQARWDAARQEARDIAATF